MRSRLSRCMIGSMALVLAVGPASAEADGVFWEAVPPSIEELTNGKVKTGDRITKENVELVRDLMPESLYELTLNDGAEFTISPHTPAEKLVPGCLVDATNRNRGKAVFREDGTVLTADGQSWIGGFPAPEPKTGREVMTNYLYRGADNWAETTRTHWVNANRETYKLVRLAVEQLLMSGRVCQDPRPYFPGYEDELARELILVLDPYDVKGLSVLTIVYVDQSRYPDAWGYIPVLRRVQRFSSGQRYDSVDGSDLRAGDIAGFSDPFVMWDFTLVGRKPILSLISSDQYRAKSFDEPLLTTTANHGWYPKGSRLELRDTYIVEATPRDPGHIYSKKLMYIDAVNWYIWLLVTFDRGGQKWYVYPFFSKPESNGFGGYNSYTYIAVWNVQTGSALMSDILEYVQNIDGPQTHPSGGSMDPNRFSTKFLMSQGR